MKYVLTLYLFLFMPVISFAQSSITSSNGNSVATLRDLQSRRLKTSDIDRVAGIVQDAFMDMNFQGSMERRVGTFGKHIPRCKAFSAYGTGTYWEPCSYYATVHLRLDSEKRHVIMRVSILDQGKDVTDPKVYQELYSIMSKSLFLERQNIPPAMLE